MANALQLVNFAAGETDGGKAVDPNMLKGQASAVYNMLVGMEL
jgi:hypothetical protein